MHRDPDMAVTDPSLSIPCDTSWKLSWRLLVARLAERHAAMLASIATALSVVGLNALQGVLLARMLGPEGRGAYSTATFYTQTLLFIGLFGGLFVFARRAAQAESSLPPLRSAALRYGLATGAATVAVVCTLTLVALPMDKRNLLPLCCVSALLLPTDHVRRLLLAIDQGSGDFRRYNVAQLVHGMALPLLLVTAWLVGQTSLQAAVGLTIVAPWIGLLACSHHWRREVGPRSPARPLLSVLAREGRAYWPSTVADDLFGRLDLLLVLWLASLPVQGYYAAAIPAAGLLCSATSAMALFSFNAGARSRAPLARGQLVRFALGVVAFQITCAAALAAALEGLIVLVYGSAFGAATSFALALLPANTLHGFAQVMEGYLRGRNRNRTSVWSRIVGASVMVAGTLALWPFYQIMAIPLAFALGHGAIAVCFFAVIYLDAGERGSP